MFSLISPSTKHQSRGAVVALLLRRDQFGSYYNDNILPPLRDEPTSRRYLSYSLDVFNPVITHLKKVLQHLESYIRMVVGW